MPCILKEARSDSPFRRADTESCIVLCDPDIHDFGQLPCVSIIDLNADAIAIGIKVHGGDVLESGEIETERHAGIIAMGMASSMGRGVQKLPTLSGSDRRGPSFALRPNSEQKVGATP